MRVVYRPMRPDERGFVISSWLLSYRKSMSAGIVPMDRWWEIMEPVVARYLARSRVIVAADPTETTRTADLFGHVVYETPPGRLPFVWYVYVKHDYRRNGLARGLLRTAGITVDTPIHYGCRTPVLTRLHEAGKLPRAEWRPLLGRVTQEETHGQGQGQDDDDRDEERARPGP